MSGQQSTQARPAGALRFACPACARFLGTAETTFYEAAPCVCGLQTTVRAVGKQARAGLTGSAERIEGK